MQFLFSLHSLVPVGVSYFKCICCELHRETKGLEGGVSSLEDEGRNYGGCGEIQARNFRFDPQTLGPSIGSCSKFCLILQPHRVAIPFPPAFASPWRNSFVQIHGGTTLLKAKIGTTPQKNWGAQQLRTEYLSFNVSYSSCWGHSLINTLKSKNQKRPKKPKLGGGWVILWYK